MIGQNPKTKTNRANVWQQDDRDAEGQRHILNCENADFERYYKAQNIVNETEWSTFLNTLKTELPTTFRVVRNGSAHSAHVEERVATLIRKHPALVRQLTWYPGSAYQIDTSRAVLRKSPELKSFHEFLVAQSEAGTLFRQEAVSMVPVLFLEPGSDSVVLDMAAAPGSKTSQLLEAMHRNCEYGEMPRGVVVANDSSTTRGHMLIHRLRCLNSPCLLVTAHNAQLYPNVFEMKAGCPKRLRYSHILCDVPCSGDGTLRKAKSIWRDWSATKGLGLHRLQLSILKRGLDLLEEGGRLVYSTCTFNPIENEAVVNAVLRNCKDGSIRLVEQSNSLVLQNFRANPGLLKCKIPDA